MQHRSQDGYSAWRLIAEELRREIISGMRPTGARLPSETQLAERFSVHRNTVRQAVAALAAEHLVVSRRGSGTFVAEHAALVNRISARFRFSEGLGHLGRATSQLIESTVDPEPPDEVADKLALGGRPGLRLESVQAVDELPIAWTTNWFVADRVPGLAEHWGATKSIEGALQAVGIEDYVRVATTVSARHATAAEAADLGLPVGSVVLVVLSLDVLADGKPLQVCITRFLADRVEFDVGHADNQLDGVARA